MKVPFYGHVKQYHAIKAEIDSNIQRVLESGQYVMGPMLERFEQELVWLLLAPIVGFPAFSFATLGQFGACFELSVTYLRWLGTNGVEGVTAPADDLHAIAETAKAFQFQLARAMARKKPLDLSAIDAMGAQWESAMSSLKARFR